NVSARDKASNKDASITVAGSSGLSDAEIEKMVNDAEKYAEEDKARREAVENANKADQTVNDTEKSLNEFAEKIDKAKAEEVKKQIEQLKELIARAQSGENVDATELKTKTDELRQSSLKLFEDLYKNQSSESKPEDK
ncbi:hypothetical protein WICPIJ_006304, partial [Wickerhamomyces pijperi]